MVLKIYEDLIKVEYQLKRWRPLSQADLRRKAAKMRDEHGKDFLGLALKKPLLLTLYLYIPVLREQKSIGEQVHQNAMGNMQRTAVEEMQIWDNGNGIANDDDEGAWMTEDVWASTGIGESGEDTVELVKRLYP
ncbi:hypothetical protein QFC24_007057 [Naganishia onofrii]|uniref:Uncharacterized protein n=1 Tax=Naganishia onofrii TaxID=1851511 RepID=A0ACC2WUS2_9TREE|nr:hypothetical protein QFC24_007057 [Naganishia onofrii]